MRKAIATNTLFKIVLGVLVFVLIAFLFYITFKDKWSDQEFKKKCLAEKLARCTNQNIGWDTKCGDENQFIPNSDECKKILGTSTT
jgi:uncharacterized membrane protein YraQ (UPF0718 family)